MELEEIEVKHSTIILYIMIAIAIVLLVYAGWRWGMYIVGEKLIIYLVVIIAIYIGIRSSEKNKNKE